MNKVELEKVNLRMKITDYTNRPEYYDFASIFAFRSPSPGQILKALRILCGYEQKELAQIVGVQQAAISKWENNLSQPGTEYLKPLAEALFISVDALLEFLCYPLLPDENEEDLRKIKTPK